MELARDERRGYVPGHPGDVGTYSANPTNLAGGSASSVHLVYVGGGAFSVEDINGALSLQ